MHKLTTVVLTVGAIVALAGCGSSASSSGGGGTATSNARLSHSPSSTAADPIARP